MNFQFRKQGSNTELGPVSMGAAGLAQSHVLPKKLLIKKYCDLALIHLDYL